MPFYHFFGEGSPTLIDDRKKDSLILTSLLDDPDNMHWPSFCHRVDPQDHMICFVATWRKVSTSLLLPSHPGCLGFFDLFR